MANYLDISTKSVNAGQGRLPKFRGHIYPTITVTTSNGTVITIDDYKENGYNSVKITDPKCDDRIYGDKIHTIYVDTTPFLGYLMGRFTQVVS